MAVSGSGEWDFFVSYTQADRTWAEWMAWELESAGYRVLVQTWDFVPGSNWIRGMADGARNASRTIAVLSDAYLDSVYGGAEWQAAWAADPTGKERKLLVVRVADCTPPALLAGLVSFDLFGLEAVDARDLLLSKVRAALSGRDKPPAAPLFPGARAVAHPPQFPGSPSAWNVPLRNPNFIGRAGELDALARGLQGDRTVTVQAVHGLGGVGKTALATEFAHAHADEYEVVWWVSAEEPTLLADQFAALVTRLGAEPAEEPDALQAQVGEAMSAVTGWLLVFDNADAVTDIRSWLPATRRPADGPGHVVVTTRRGGFRSLGQVLNLDVVTGAEAVALLRTRAADLDQATAEAIAVELGRLPLALEQAAAYLDVTGQPGEDYLQLLRTRAADLYRRGQPGSGAGTIATVWNISVERVTAASPAALQLLDICACLAPEPVPLDLFTAHPGLLPEPLSSVAADPVAFNDCVGVLLDYSLAKRSPAGLQLHRLVQGAVRANSDGTPLRVAAHLLANDAPDQIADTPGSWPRWAVLLPHVLAVINLLDGEPGSAEQTDDTSWLLNRAASYLRVHARLNDALPLLERALAINEAAYGPDASEVATQLHDLAGVLHDMGRLPPAIPLLERALAIDEAAHGPDHPEVGSHLNSLGLVLGDLGRLQEARPLLERSLAIDEADKGPDHQEVAIRLSNLALTLGELGRHEEALPLLERALAIDEAAYAPDHPHIATLLNNLATTLRDLARFQEALPLLERALAIDEAAYAPDHPDIAVDLNNIALTLRDLDRPGEALPLLERAMAVLQAAYGPDHPNLAACLNNVAKTLGSLGREQEALPLYERALTIIESAYGADHATAGTFLNNLAKTLEALGRPEEAQPLFERVKAIRLKAELEAGGRPSDM